MGKEIDFEKLIELVRNHEELYVDYRNGELHKICGTPLGKF